MPNLANPYAPPVQDAPAFSADVLHAGPQMLASRGQRFVAALIDGVFLLLVSAPLIAGVVAVSGWEAFAEMGVAANVAWTAAGFVIYALAQAYWLRNGQTAGKAVMKIRMVDADTGATAKMDRILLMRALPVQLVQLIPVVGSILGLIDVLFIFGADHRCLHDRIANTRVVTTL